MLVVAVEGRLVVVEGQVVVAMVAMVVVAMVVVAMVLPMTMLSHRDLQVVVGDYTNTTKFFTQKNKCWCAPVREYAQSQCSNCGLSHSIDTPCKGGDSCVKMPANERHSACPSNMIKDMEEGTFKRLTQEIPKVGIFGLIFK